MNAVIKAYLHHFTNHTQDNWYPLLLMVTLHVIGQPMNVTGISPFMLTHRWDINTLELFKEMDRMSLTCESPVTQGECIVSHLQNAVEWVQASMAAAQEDYE